MVRNSNCVAAGILARLLSFACGCFLGVAALRTYDAVPDGSLLVASRLLLLFGVPQTVAAYVALRVAHRGAPLAIFSGVAAAAAAAFLITWLTLAEQAPAGTDDGRGLPALALALMLIFLPLLNGAMAFVSAAAAMHRREARSL